MPMMLLSRGRSLWFLQFHHFFNKNRQQHLVPTSSCQRTTSTSSVTILLALAGIHNHQSISHRADGCGERGGVVRTAKPIIPQPSWSTTTSSTSSFRTISSTTTLTNNAATDNVAHSGSTTTTTDTTTTSSTPNKVTAISLTSKKRRGHKISMVTAYDYPSAIHVTRAGIDILLVGDSVGMVELGYATTQSVTMEMMLHHCAAVHRGVLFALGQSTTSSAVTSLGGTGSNPTPQQQPLLIADMPFGSYEFDNTDIALKNAYRFIQETQMDAVKLEGGSLSRARTARHIVNGGIAVMGHVGLMPQAISVLGGFRAQGRTAVRARELLDDALRLQDAGVFAMLLECIPANVAAAITETLEIPTIGIGAGGMTSGQVLVYHDMLGMSSHPHHEQFVPKFCKRYGQVGHLIQEGLRQYKQDVESGVFPAKKYSPYVMKEEERQVFETLLAQDAEQRKRKHELAAVKYTQTDEYEKLHLYGNDATKSE